MPCFEPSRPKPDSLMPPKGAGIGKDDEGCVTAKLEAQTLKRVGGLLHQELPHARRTRERELADDPASPVAGLRTSMRRSEASCHAPPMYAASFKREGLASCS